MIYCEICLVLLVSLHSELQLFCCSVVVLFFENSVHCSFQFLNKNALLLVTMNVALTCIIR